MKIEPPKVVTTERTAKRFKVIMLIGVIGLILSPSCALIGLLWVENIQTAMNLLACSAIMAGISMAIYLVGHGLAWWYHG
jgi:hypothetical protein